jgi:hypothetical protein
MCVINRLYSSDASTALPVTKQWKREGKTVILTESLNWKEIVPKLNRLPDLAATKDNQQTAELAMKENPSTPLKHTLKRKTVIQVARLPYKTTGFVLDYPIIVTSGYNFLFTWGFTYW